MEKWATGKKGNGKNGNRPIFGGNWTFRRHGVSPMGVSPTRHYR